jgi:hypothetical protein
MSIDKQFHGDLEATSNGEMIAAQRHLGRCPRYLKKHSNPSARKSVQHTEANQIQAVSLSVQKAHDSVAEPRTLDKRTRYAQVSGRERCATRNPHQDVSSFVDRCRASCGGRTSRNPGIYIHPCGCSAIRPFLPHLGDTQSRAGLIALIRDLGR